MFWSLRRGDQFSGSEGSGEGWGIKIISSFLAVLEEECCVSRRCCVPGVGRSSSPGFVVVSMDDFMAGLPMLEYPAADFVTMSFSSAQGPKAVIVYVSCKQ